MVYWYTGWEYRIFEGIEVSEISLEISPSHGTCIDAHYCSHGFSVYGLSGLLEVPKCLLIHTHKTFTLI